MFINNFEYKQNNILILFGDVKQDFKNDIFDHLNEGTYLFI
jgi:hypothetical protein